MMDDRLCSHDLMRKDCSMKITYSLRLLQPRLLDHANDIGSIVDLKLLVDASICVRIVVIAIPS